MGGPRHKRQFILFVAAILVPTAVLVGLAMRLIRQETELSEKRATDERRTAWEQLRRESAARPHRRNSSVGDSHGIPELRSGQQPASPRADIGLRRRVLDRFDLRNLIKRAEARLVQAKVLACDKDFWRRLDAETTRLV
jgi:hypothetical protein